ncbi:baculoviral IAP repeat-containing protein 1e-like [Hyperolius riggenbachi]|uniref:baculoviral IAP repeat-containing protein 1e-like n=1 Tax=Hyperolius riggenbachi TaxID=752182 RepID=UPI0035A3A3F1
MASSGHSEDDKESVDLINFNEFDSLEFVQRLPIDLVFGIDWSKFAKDLQAKQVTIRQQLGTQYNFDMRCEAKRLKSFLSLHESNQSSWWSPEVTSSAGFYFTGVCSSVQCFCCGLVLSRCPLASSPEKLHVEHNPTCSFMKGEDVGNISKYEVPVQTSDLDPASLDMYKTEKVRLKSYRNWPFYARIQPDQLAAAGFFCTGRRDAVQCFSCGGCLGNWQETDPWKQHAKWFPECDYLKSKKTSEEIQEYISSYIGFEGCTGKYFNTSSRDCTTPPETAVTNLNIFKDENVRLESFKTWPPLANAEPSGLVKAGFFYTGKSDAVRCYTCGVTVSQFEPGEDPLTEHEKHNPNCNFVKQILELKSKDTEDVGYPSNMQMQLVDEFPQNVEQKDVLKTENNLKICNITWSNQAGELKRSLMDVYSNSTFSKLSPFPGSSHISVDLKSLFADISTVLKDTRNQPVRWLTLPDILSELRDITMIEGEVGSGKTALLRKIAILWASGKCPLLSRFSLVFYISLSCTDSQQSLHDIICQQLVGTTTAITEESLREIINQLKEKVLFLLDDYGMMESLPGVIQELLLKNPWNRMTITVTVSTDKSSSVRQFAKNIVSIQDFPLCSSLYIYEQLFSHDKPFLEGFICKLIQSETLQAALKTPLFALALCVCWVQKPSDYVSEDFSICKNYLMHIMLKHNTEKGKLEVVVLSCGQLALQGIFQPRFEFTQENLDEAGVNRSDALRFGLLSMFSSQRLRPIFRFFHPSFQEYLASIKMNDLLHSEDDTQNRIGLSYLQEINTFLEFIGRYHYFLKNCCMHSPKTTTVIISHLFSLLDNREAFKCQRDSNLHLKHHPELETREQMLCNTINMDICMGLVRNINDGSLQDYIVCLLLDFAIEVVSRSKYMDHCAPTILQFLKGKDIACWGKSTFSQLGFLRKYPEGLSLLKSLEINVHSAINDTDTDVWDSDAFKSIWEVPTVEEDYSMAFRHTADILKNNPDFRCKENVNAPDISKLRFDPAHHRIPLLRVNAHGWTLEDKCIPFFCSLANRIELDLRNSHGFLQNIWSTIDQYKTLVVKLIVISTELSREEQEQVTYLTSLECLEISEMPPPEYILANIHNFREIKELVVENSSGTWDIMGILPDEFKNLQNIEKLVFKNIDLSKQCNRLAKMLGCFPNLTSFTLQCDYCSEIDKIVIALCQKEKMEKLSLPVFSTGIRPLEDSVKIIKFADDTTIIGLVSENDEQAYRKEVDRICNWCSENGLVLNTAKTVEMVIDFRKHASIPPPIYIEGNEVARVSSVRLLGTTISDDLTWRANTTATQRKAQQRLFFLRQLKKFGMAHELLRSFYSATIESVLCSSILVWFASCTGSDRYKLQRVISSAERIIGKPLPPLDLLYNTRLRNRALKIVGDPSHPGHRSFSRLKLGRRFRSIPAKTTRPSALPSLKKLKILEVQNTYLMDVEEAKLFAQNLRFLENLEEFTFPMGSTAMETVSLFIQPLQYMPNLRKLFINCHVLTDSSLLELANLTAAGHLRNLQDLELMHNSKVTQSGWRDFFNTLDSLPDLKYLNVSRVIADQFKADPVTLTALIRCVSRLLSLRSLAMFGWLLDEKDLELINEMKSKHPQGKGLMIDWKTILPFAPVIIE